jgi:hypothetical protein
MALFAIGKFYGLTTLFTTEPSESTEFIFCPMNSVVNIFKLFIG